MPFHCSEFTQEEGKDVKEAHAIGVQFIREGWQESIVSVVAQAFIAKGRDESLNVYSPVSSTFTLQKFEDDLGADKIILSPYAGVPKGVPMMSFRADMPRGWVALDGTGTWPKENWVPQHLQGTALPDMRGAFARGATGEEKSGLVNGAGNITIPNITVSGSNFTAVKKGAGGLPNTTGTLDSVIDYGYPPNQLVSGISTIVTSSTLYNSRMGRITDNYKITLQPMPLLNGTISGSQTVTGQTLPLSNPAHQPRHATGQWIMRIK